MSDVIFECVSMSFNLRSSIGGCMEYGCIDLLQKLGLMGYKTTWGWITRNFVRLLIILYSTNAKGQVAVL